MTANRGKTAKAACKVEMSTLPRKYSSFGINVLELFYAKLPRKSVTLVIGTKAICDGA